MLRATAFRAKGINAMRIATLLFVVLTGSFGTRASAETPDRPERTARRKTLRVAAVVTVFRHNAHAEMIVGRLVEGYNLDGKPPFPSLKLVSLYVDQTPANDLSRGLAANYKFPIFKTVDGALTLGTGKLAVDGVLLVAEHGSYGLSKTGQRLYPKRRLFEAVFKVFEQSKRAVPVFTDKHLSDNWTDAKWIWDTARRLNVPLMAGSSVPTYRRQPPLDVDRKRRLAEIVAVGYGGTESYGFHALEMMQSLAERRRGGETGVVSVQSVTGDDVWKSTGKLYDDALLKAALSASRIRRPADKPLRESVRKPVLISIRYADGLRGSLFMLNGTATEFSAAWRYQGDGRDSRQATVFQLQDERPYSHFTTLLKGIERMMHSGKPTWPAERTLLTTGVLHEGFLSQSAGGKIRRTPHLAIRYRSAWNWRQPEKP
jgi:hypothetical protein